MIDTGEIKAHIEQVTHASACIHADCVRCTSDIPKPARLALLLANDASLLLVRVAFLEAERRDAQTVRRS